jgi:hypothetical protein
MMRRAVLIAIVLAACTPAEDGTVAEQDTGVAADSAIDTTISDTGSVDSGADDTTTTETAPETSAVDSSTTETTVDAPVDVAVDTTVIDTAMVDTMIAETTAETSSDTLVTDTAIDAGPTCNTLAQIGGSVTIQRVAAPAPTLSTAGGAIPAGTYVLTALTLYTGTGGATGSLGTTKLTTIITPVTGGMNGQAIDDDPGGAGNHRSTTTSVFTGANSFTQTWTCRYPLPLIGPLTATYEISGTTLKLLYDASKTLYVLEKQP